MIYFNFIYKGAVIQFTEFEMPYTAANKKAVQELFEIGEIARPENWDRTIITEKPLPEWL